MVPLPTPSEGTGRRVGLDPDTVVERALAIVEAEGADALTMRRLAADLDVTTTTVYWHVGGREAVIAALIERHARRLAEAEVVGTTRERVLSVTRHLWESALAHPNVTGLAHRTGASAAANFPLHVALVRELEAAGVRGPAARDALGAIVCCVAGFLVLALRASAPTDLAGERLWGRVADDAIDPGTVLALMEPADLAPLFEPTLRAVIEHHVPA